MLYYTVLYYDIPVVPARGGAEVAFKIYMRPFSSIELACAVRQPSPCVRALCESGVLLHMSHLKLHFAHFSLQSSHSTLHTALFTLHTALLRLHTSHSTLHTSHCALKTPHFTLHTSHSTLHTSHCTLRTPNFTLHTSHFTVHTSHFSLLTELPYLHQACHRSAAWNFYQIHILAHLSLRLHASVAAAWTFASLSTHLAYCQAPVRSAQTVAAMLFPSHISAPPAPSTFPFLAHLKSHMDASLQKFGKRLPKHDYFDTMTQ